jgi:hypothetical protein
MISEIYKSEIENAMLAGAKIKILSTDGSTAIVFTEKGPHGFDSIATYPDDDYPTLSSMPQYRQICANC